MPIPRIFTVRADYGKYADAFKKGGYAAVGWMPDLDLSRLDVSDLREAYQAAYPEISKASVIGNHVGQISRFLFDIQPGDYVITPTSDSEWINFGVVQETSYQYVKDDSCPHPHRRPVKWNKEPLRRPDFSVPLQNTMRALLTVFEVSQIGEIFALIGKPELAPFQVQKFKIRIQLF